MHVSHYSAAQYYTIGCQLPYDVIQTQTVGQKEMSFSTGTRVLKTEIEEILSVCVPSVPHSASALSASCHILTSHSFAH